jgi:hypothetical protein
VEVKIGVQHTPREITLESAQTPAEVETLVSAAMRNPEGLLSLADEKGRVILVPSSLVAYVEIAQADVRRVGFAG